VAAAVVPGIHGPQLIVLGGIDVDTMKSSDAVYTYKNPEDVQRHGEVEKEGNEMSSALGRWSELPIKLLRPRYRHTAAVHNGKLWVIGGIVKATAEEIEATAATVHAGAAPSNDNVEKYTASTECMDLNTGVWTAGPCMTTRRAIDVTAIVVNDELYVFGGNIGIPVASAEGGYKEVDALGTIEKLDESTNTFQQVQFQNITPPLFALAPHLP
jgi:hypothetical protein